MQDAIICKNCGNQFSGRFCNECGEKVYTDHDKTFRHFVEEGFHFLTHFDSKFLRSWWLVMTRPGFVSTHISAGIRKRYYKPVNLFIIGVILYLLFPVLQGLNVKLVYHIYSPYRGIAEELIYQKMASHHLKFEELAVIFDNMSPKFAKILLLIIIPLSGLALQWLFRKKRRYYFDHITLASELNTFYLYFTFLIVPILSYILSFISKGSGEKGGIFWSDYFTISFYLIVLGIYCTKAFRRFYQEKGGWTILKSVIFLLAHSVIVFVLYRLILLCVVLLFI